MPIIEREYIGDHGILGVWEITESLGELLNMIQFSPEDVKIFKKFKNKSRQKHWLSYRLAIREILGEEKNLEFSYDEHGKLHIANYHYKLSVSHSGNYSAVIISNKHNVGIDMEKITNRINELEDKFLAAFERKRLPVINRQKYLTAFWSAKETLFKLYGKRELQFGKNIFIDFKDINSKGSLIGKIKNTNFEKDYHITYRVFRNYMLVYAIDDIIH